MNEILDILAKAKSGAELSESEAYAFQKSLFEGKVATPELLEFLTSLDGRKIVEGELRGFYNASLEASVHIADSSDSLDTCGTGGDKSGSFNISTASGILLSAMGVPVAKHGNRAASSKCGSADVLEALGVRLEQTPAQAESMLREVGFVFLYARQYHPAFKHAGEARKIYGKRAYFNFLGPLLNPARAKYRVHGLSDFSYAETLGNILLDSGVERALFVHAKNGMDEASPFSDTEFYLTQKGGYTLKDEFPTSSYASGSPDELLAPDSAEDNAKLLRSIFGGMGTEAQNYAVALNAGLGLCAYRGPDTPFRNATKEAYDALKSGVAATKLAQIIEVSNKV